MQISIINKAHEFWKEKDFVGYQILLSLASTENVPNYDISSELESQLLELDQGFNRPGGVDFEQSPSIIKILGSLDVVLEFYLVKRYDLAYPGASADILSLANAYSKDAEYAAYANALLRRHIVFERMKIMCRVFSKDRIEQITSFIKENGDKYRI